MEWLRFWWSCIKWTFGRWEKEKGRAMTFFAYFLVAFPTAKTIPTLADKLPGWWIGVPILFLLLFVAPYFKCRESEEEYRELRRVFDSEKFQEENESYRTDVKRFMDFVRDMYARYSKDGRAEADLDKVLRRAPHLTPTERDPTLAAFARLVYPETTNKSSKGLYLKSIACRGGVPPLLTLEQYTEFDNLRGQLVKTIGRWERLSPLCGQWGLVASTLQEPIHEDAIKILRYLEEAKGEIFGSTSNSPDQLVGWSLLEKWKRQLPSE